MNKNDEKCFKRGIAIACANINSDHDQPTICKSGLSGFTKQDFIDAGVPRWDMDRLENVFDEYEALKGGE